MFSISSFSVHIVGSWGMTHLRFLRNTIWLIILILQDKPLTPVLGQLRQQVAEVFWTARSKRDNVRRKIAELFLQDVFFSHILVVGRFVLKVFSLYPGQV